ncbi:peptidase [Streptomyces sp. NPDC092296]|uniref:peptidase n=1 Tax=Streptomyces sp. NPDC092296 TaxID=3366012 RepID=UPI0038191D6A
MKLRRTLVTAAATAAIAPIALLSASSAFAVDAPGAGATASSPASEQTESTPSTEEAAQGAEDTTPVTEDTTPAEVAPTTTPPAKAEDEPTEPGKETGKPGDDGCTDHVGSPGTLADLRDLPSKIVAGSGWHGFTFRISNYTGTAFTSYSADMNAFSYADGTNADTSQYLHVQWYDGAAWKDLDTRVKSKHEEFGNGGSLAPRAHADIKLRIKVDAQAPAGLGGSMAFAASVDTDGICGSSVPEDQEYSFQILPAATKPGKVPPTTAQPKPTAQPSNTPAPQPSSTPPTGSLADTGSSSALPIVGVVGGVAALAGAGVVYSVRRRNLSDQA